MTNEEIARVCHEANRAYCLVLGDTSQLPWDEAPEWARRSAIVGVGFHAEGKAHGITLRPSASHESWLEEKRREGWKHGPTKNPETKEHPCFVPYSDLPPEQKLKDALFVAICGALLP